MVPKGDTHPAVGDMVLEVREPVGLIPLAFEEGRYSR